MNNIIKSIVLAFAITTFACGKMIGQETLTVYDGSTTNNHIPMYVYYFDDFTRSQYVIPASELGEMDGGRITSMKFYPNSSTAYTTVSEVDIYLKEVGYTSISAFENKSSATIVYHGTVVFGGGSATITFTTPFTYNGGNLLIGCDNTTDAGYSSIYFYGQSVTGASVSGSNASSLANVTATQQNFIPETTFTYTIQNLSCPKPIDLEASNVTSSSATLSWT
ncbi:MAG: hypothetical protein IIU33_09660, partial [Bacteroidales bacterium]|nr:hypothetical protein [Bacteroidales bacterium]